MKLDLHQNPYEFLQFTQGTEEFAAEEWSEENWDGDFPNNHHSTLES